MGSRLRENVYYLFECFCEVSQGNGREPSIVRKFPESYNNAGELDPLPKFTFPCEFENSQIQHYSFVLTSTDSKYTFYFCRYDPRTKASLVLLSYLPWHDIFYRLLNCISPLLHSKDRTELLSFLTACRIRPPMLGHTLKVTYNAGHNVFTCECPDKSLPTIPENCNLTEFFSALDSKCMAGLWAALLHERRVVVVASKLSRLSATVQAANTILYPMSWQHIFIPILPKHLVEYLLAPMPFLIGVPRSLMETVKLTDIGDVVILDADANTLKSSFNDLETLPNEVVSALRKSLSDKNLLGDGVSRAFLRALGHLIGDYRNAIRIETDKQITFNPEEFVKTRKSMQPFLHKILQSQIFQQFIEERLELLNAGRGFSDEFELESYSFADKSHGGSGQHMKQQYREWVKGMKRDGGAILKTVKDKANPAVKSAVNSVRQGGRNVKSAVKGFRMKMPKHNSRSSSVNTMDDSRFSYGSGTPVSSGSSDSLRSQGSSRSAPLTPPVLPLDLLGEMQLHFSTPPDNTTINDNLFMHHTPLEKAKSMSRVSATLPPRLPQRPSIPSRYPIVPTRNLLNLSDAPKPPPRSGSAARGQTRFYSEITRSEGRAPAVPQASSVRFTQVYPDGGKVKAGGEASERKLSLWKATTRAPVRNGDVLKATVSAPAASAGARDAPRAATAAAATNHNTIDSIQPREASERDLIQLEVSKEGERSPRSAPLTLDDFDPLKCAATPGCSPRRSTTTDRDLLHEYGLDFSRFGLNELGTDSSAGDSDYPSHSKPSLPKEWTTFN